MARWARDLAIECAARLDSTIYEVQESCSMEYFLRYRRACAFPMADIGLIVNRIARAFPSHFPNLSKMKREEWIAIAVERRSAVRPSRDLAGRDLVLFELEYVSSRVAELRSKIPELEEDLGSTPHQLMALRELVRQWDPAPPGPAI